MNYVSSSEFLLLFCVFCWKIDKLTIVNDGNRRKPAALLHWCSLDLHCVVNDWFHLLERFRVPVLHLQHFLCVGHIGLCECPHNMSCDLSMRGHFGLFNMSAIYDSVWQRGLLLGVASSLRLITMSNFTSLPFLSGVCWVVIGIILPVISRIFYYCNTVMWFSDDWSPVV